jgi:hypothetical protein
MRSIQGQTRRFVDTRGDWTPLELFCRGLVDWDAGLRGPLSDQVEGERTSSAAAAARRVHYITRNQEGGRRRQAAQLSDVEQLGPARRRMGP